MRGTPRVSVRSPDKADQKTAPNTAPQIPYSDTINVQKYMCTINAIIRIYGNWIFKVRLQKLDIYENDLSVIISKKVTKGAAKSKRMGLMGRGYLNVNNDLFYIKKMLEAQSFI